MLVAPKKRCEKPSFYDNDNDVVGDVDDISKCYHACKNKASMFVFGRVGGQECTANGRCVCRCEMTASENKTCEQTDDDAFDLYRINNGIQSKFLHFQIWQKY